MTAAIQITDRLETTSCCVCGMTFAVPAGWLQKRRDDKTGFVCPNGHSLSFAESVVERLQRELATKALALAEKERAFAAADAARRIAVQNEMAARERESKLKQRARGGLCPCCRRSFTALSRHMKAKHPEFGKRSAP